MSVHNDPARNGTTFGVVTVTVDLDAGDCMLRVDAAHRRAKTPRFHSVEEIQGAYQVQLGLGATDPVAADIARALKFAAQRLVEHRGGKRRG